MKNKFQIKGLKMYAFIFLIFCVLFFSSCPCYAELLDKSNSNKFSVEFLNGKEKLKTNTVKKIKVRAFNNSENHKECTVIVTLCDKKGESLNFVTSTENIKPKESSEIVSYMNILPQGVKVKAFIVEPNDYDNRLSNIAEISTSDPIITDDIVDIKDINVNLNQGEAYTLPNKVLALMESNKVKAFPVKWNGTADTSKVGVYKFQGIVEGYDKKVNLILNVNLVEKIEDIEDINVCIEQDSIYNFPKIVIALMNTGEVKKVPVIFNVQKVDTSVVGTFTYEGAVKGYDKKVKLNITITPKNANEPIIFKNSELESIIREEIDKEEGDIFIKDLENITSLSLAWALYDNTNIEDIKYLKNLVDLDLTNITLNNIDCLSNLTKLESLNLFSTGIEDISALKNLVNLKDLNLANNGVKNINYLKGLTALESLNLNGNSIEDISPLSNMLNLKKLYLSGNDGIEDYSPTIKYYKNLNNPDFELKLYKADSNNIINKTILKGESFVLPSAIKSIIDGKDKEVFVKWNVQNVDTNIVGIQTFEGVVDASDSKIIFKLLVNPLKDDDVIIFPDKNLEAAIRKAIDKPNGEIYRSDVKYLTKLEGYYKGIEDLTGIENLVSLEEVMFASNKISDLSCLSSLTNLKILDLAENKIRILRAETFKNLNKLESLILDNNKITTIKPGAFSGLTNLKDLHMEENSISDLSEFSKLTNLRELYLRDNLYIRNIRPLSNLKNLTLLWIGNNVIEDISTLSNLTNLTWLEIDKNQITSLLDLKPLVKMERLSVKENSLKRLSGIEDMKKLSWLEAEKNDIWDINEVKELTNLEILQLNNNAIENAGAIEKLANLTQLYLNTNKIKEITALSDLNKLKVLKLRDNKITDYSPTKGYYHKLNIKDFTLN